jgi:predicted ribosome quality control (RQC) complex YloA/Tae2 family protein
MENKKEEESQTNAPADEKASNQEDLIKKAKETLQKVVDLYKDAPEAINEAKKVKQQVEKIYQEREKAMKEMR